MLGAHYHTQQTAHFKGDPLGLWTFTLTCHGTTSAEMILLACVGACTRASKRPGPIGVRSGASQLQLPNTAPLQHNDLSYFNSFCASAQGPTPHHHRCRPSTLASAQLGAFLALTRHSLVYPSSCCWPAYLSSQW